LVVMTGDRVRATVLAAVSGAMAGCGVAAGPRATAPPLLARPPVAWLNTAVIDHAQPFTIPGVAACRSADVAVSVHVADPSYIGGGPANTTFWVIDIRDTSARPCFVGAQPEVSFSAGGAALHIPRTATEINGDVVYLSATAAPPFFARAGGEIDVTPCALHGVDRVTVGLGGNLGSVTVDPGPPAGAGPSCPVANETYSAFLQGESDSDTVAGTLPLTQTTISGAPSVVTRGEVVYFTVTITNSTTPHHGIAFTRPTPNPTITFQLCPSYHEELEGVAGSFHTFRLDCTAAEPIAGGGSERFAMQITVPADAPPGPATLVWCIDGSAVVYQTAGWDVEIA
jgi:hypothetical protein